MKNLRRTNLSQPTITTTYAGEFAGNYIASAILSANTIANNGVTVRANVKYKEVIKQFVSEDLIQDATCDFDNAGTVSLSDRVLVVDEKQVNIELCKTPFQSDWDAVQMGYSAFDVLPSSFSDFFIGRMLNEVALSTEKYLWNVTNGFPFLLEADGATVVASTSIDATNVIAEMRKVVTACPDAIYGKEDLKLFVSQKVAKAYVSALGGFATNIGANGLNAQGTTWYTSGGALSFDGIPVFVANGLKDQNSNLMVLTTVSNLYFGTGLLDDQNLVQTIDMAQIDGSKNVRFVMRWTQGLQVGFGADAVVYGTFV
jgi:hypothetical protein